MDWNIYFTLIYSKGFYKGPLDCIRAYFTDSGGTTGSSRSYLFGVIVRVTDVSTA